MIHKNPDEENRQGFLFSFPNYICIREKLAATTGAIPR